MNAEAKAHNSDLDCTACRRGFSAFKSGFNAKEEAETIKMTRKQKRVRQEGGALPTQSFRSLSPCWVCLTTNFIASMKKAAEQRNLCSSMLPTEWLTEEEGTEKRDRRTLLLRSAVDTVRVVSTGAQKGQIFSSDPFSIQTLNSRRHQGQRQKTGPFIC